MERDEFIKALRGLAFVALIVLFVVVLAGGAAVVKHVINGQEDCALTAHFARYGIKEVQPQGEGQ